LIFENLKRTKSYFWPALMSKIFLHILVCLLSLVPADPVAEIHQAIKTSNHRYIARYFGTSVELKLPGNEGLFSKAQSELLLRDFFLRNPPKSFVVRHEGTAADGSRYSIGKLETQNGSSFRTYLYLKKQTDHFLLREFRIEKEK
jgi:hypothetical protein